MATARERASDILAYINREPDERSRHKKLIDLVEGYERFIDEVAGAYELLAVAKEVSGPPVETHLDL